MSKNMEPDSPDCEFSLAKELLEHYSPALIQKIKDEGLIAESTIMLSYITYSYDSDIKISLDILKNFMKYAHQFLNIYNQHLELFEDDPADWEQHSLPWPFLFSKFAPGRPIFKPYVKKFRYVMYTIRYYNFFIQSYLRCHVLTSKEAVEAAFEKHRGDSASALSTLLDELCL